MRTLLKCVLPIVLAAALTGCATSGKVKPAETASQQDTRINEMLEQVDRNAAAIRENNDGMAEMSRRLADIENKLNTIMTDNNATVQEIKENLAFMNDQILRLDNSMRTTRTPVSRPPAASVFKPGGFDASTAYKGALDEYYSRRYESAISGFTELLTVAPNHSLADNAQYWIGESYYAIGNYTKALESFHKVFDFPKSNKLSDAHYKIGKTHLQLGNTDGAKEELRAVVQNYPGTSAAKYAAQELSKLGE